jgi:PPOX class probable F420-dependent enzyme
MVTIDTSTPFGKRVRDRLENEIVVWLVTVAPDGTPQPSLVWFYWHEESMLIYSQPGKPKVRNIEQNARVSVHFDSDTRTGNVVVFTGSAVIDSAIPPVHEMPGYAAKYHDEILRIGFPDEKSFAQAYSVPIRITPEKLWGH